MFLLILLFIHVSPDAQTDWVAKYSKCSASFKEMGLINRPLLQSNWPKDGWPQPILPLTGEHKGVKGLWILAGEKELHFVPFPTAIHKRNLEQWPIRIQSPDKKRGDLFILAYKRRDHEPPGIHFQINHRPSTAQKKWAAIPSKVEITDETRKEVLQAMHDLLPGARRFSRDSHGRYLLDCRALLNSKDPAEDKLRDAIYQTIVAMPLEPQVHPWGIRAIREQDI